MSKIFKKILTNKLGMGAIDLVLAISIIGTTTAAGLTKVDDILMTARDTRRQMDMHQVETALHLYYLDQNTYPVTANSAQPTEAGWQIISSQLSTANNNTGPWISEVSDDPLADQGYHYRYASNGDTFILQYQQEQTGELKTIENF